MTSDLTELAKGYYRAYERHDRSFMEENMGRILPSPVRSTIISTARPISAAAGRNSRCTRSSTS